MLPLVFALLGLIGIGLGIFLGRRLKARREVKPALAGVARASWIVGVALGIASVVFARFISYPVISGTGRSGRVYGWPFVVRILDDLGRDGCGRHADHAARRTTIGFGSAIATASAKRSLRW